MNKHCHKIVFNRRRGILMAVAETAVGQGKSPGERSGGETGGGNGSLKTHSGCRLHLGTLAFSLLLGFGSALIVPAAAADIQADKSAPKSQQPSSCKPATDCRRSISKPPPPTAYPSTNTAVSMSTRAAPFSTTAIKAYPPARPAGYRATPFSPVAKPV